MNPNPNTEEGLVKNGMLTEDSHCDYEPEKKAAYYDEEGFTVASEDNKKKLKKPKRIATNHP